MLKMRIFFSAVVLVLMLTVQFVTARTASASIPSYDSASMLSIQKVSTIQNQAHALLYRFSVENCLGMPPRALASCRNGAKQSTLNTNPIESDFPCVARIELDRYEEFQPPSIYGDGFPYPDERDIPCIAKEELDRYEEFQPPSIYGDGFPYP